MDFKDTQKNAKYVRLDVAAVVFILFIIAIYASITSTVIYGVGLLTTGFMLVGYSVAFEWRKFLQENGFVELEPLAAILAGGVVILILQTIFGIIALDLHIMLAIVYGIASAFGYDSIAFFISFYNLNGENYVTHNHPKKDDTDPYVFEEDTYIQFLEEEAVKMDPDETYNL